MLRVGDLLADRYRIDARLGVGGMATVHRARDLRLGRDVAVKVLLPNLAADPALVERFLREAHALATVNHPAVVAVYDVDGGDQATGREPFYVMELCPDGSLADRLRADGPLSPDLAIPLLASVADGLAELHRRGLVHRDVKPHNILLSGDRAKIGDFGVVLVEAPGERALTVDGTTLGTLAYLAPERLTGQPATHAADVYGLAASVFEALTGRRPRPAGTVAELVDRRGEEPPPVSTVRPALGTSFDAVVAAGLAADPTRRPEASEFARGLATTLAAWRRAAGGRVPAAAPSVGLPASPGVVPAPGVGSAAGVGSAPGVGSAAGVVPGAAPGPTTLTAARARPGASAAPAPRPSVRPVASPAAARVPHDVASPAPQAAASASAAAGAAAARVLRPPRPARPDRATEAIATPDAAGVGGHAPAQPVRPSGLGRGDGEPAARSAPSAARPGPERVATGWAATARPVPRRRSASGDIGIAVVSAAIAILGLALVVAAMASWIGERPAAGTPGAGVPGVAVVSTSRPMPGRTLSPTPRPTPRSTPAPTPTPTPIPSPSPAPAISPAVESAVQDVRAAIEAATGHERLSRRDARELDGRLSAVEAAMARGDRAGAIAAAGDLTTDVVALVVAGRVGGQIGDRLFSSAIALGAAVTTA